MQNSTIRIGTLELAGRIVMPPLGTYMCTDDGKVTDELVGHYAARARNPHVSMIITEHSYISIQGQAMPRQLSLSDDSDIEGLSRLVEAIHEGGAKVMCQLNHGGTASPAALTGRKADRKSVV